MSKVRCELRAVRMLQQTNLVVQGGDQKALTIIGDRNAADGLQQLVRDQLTLANIIAT